MAALIDGARTPQHSLDEQCKDGYARVIVVIEGIRAKSVFKSKEAGNADVTLTFSDREFNLVVKQKKEDGTDNVYQLLARTPQSIEDAPKSYHKVEKDKISIFLKKVVKKSWLQAGETIEVVEPEES